MAGAPPPPPVPRPPPPPPPPAAPPPPGGLKRCASCGQNVGAQYVVCPYCQRPTAGAAPTAAAPPPPPPPPAYGAPPPVYGAPPPGYAPGYPPPGVVYAAPPPRETIGDGLKILFYILSFLIPLVGFIIGIIYYTKTEPELKNVGKTCLIIAILSMVINCLCYFLFLGAAFF